MLIYFIQIDNKFINASYKKSAVEIILDGALHTALIIRFFFN